MKIAKYTMYVEIVEGDYSTEELQTAISSRVLNRISVTGQCLLVEETSKEIDTDGMTDWEFDERPLNFRENSRNPDIWEQELKGYWIMDDKEITALAREYAEETVSHTRLSTTVADDTEDVIRFLLRRYCLVEKSKVEKEYQSSKHYFEHTDNSNPTQKQYFWGRICALEYLFPEIAKEVES